MLEPDKATPGQTFRRLALGSHCSLLLALPPHHPRELPTELYVLGPESAARPLQSLIERAPSLWDVSRCTSLSLHEKRPMYCAYHQSSFPSALSVTLQ